MVEDSLNTYVIRKLTFHFPWYFRNRMWKTKRDSEIKENLSSALISRKKKTT